MLILLLPVLFVNHHDWHNWGGDFAQYIAQAKNLVEGSPVQNTGYIYTIYNAGLAPPSYPVGFPIILMPVYALFGLNISAFTFYMSLMMFVAGMMFFIFLKKHFPLPYAAMLTLVFIYNPWMMEFKEQILSDVPFLIFFLACFIQMEKSVFSVSKALVAGVLAGMMISIREVGLFFPVAIAATGMSHFFLGKISGRVLFHAVLTIIIAVLIYLLLNKWLFPAATSEGYLKQFNFSNLWFFVQRNLHLNFEYLREFLSGQENPPVWKLIFSYALMLLALAGFLTQLMRKGWGLMEFSFVVYIALIFSFPFYQGFRYLLPMLPFFIFYLMKGIELPVRLSSVNHNYVIAFLTVIFAIFYLPENLRLHQQRHVPRWSPDEPFSKEGLHYIKANLPDDAVILFEKPRVLALFTGRKSLTFAANPADAEALLRDFRVDYFAESLSLYNEVYRQFLDHFNEKSEVWRNEEFVIYKNER